MVIFNSYVKHNQRVPHDEHHLHIHVAVVGVFSICRITDSQKKVEDGVSGRSWQIEGLLKQPGDSKGHAGRTFGFGWLCELPDRTLGLFFFDNMTMTQYRAGHNTHVMTLLIDFGWRSQLTLDESLNKSTVDGVIVISSVFGQTTTIFLVKPPPFFWD